jgi:membrane-bound serine protease (ClpP class)
LACGLKEEAPIFSGMGLVITLVAIGTVLLILETVLPGMIAGIIGFGCLVAAVVHGYLEFGVKGGNALLLLVAVGLVAGTLFWMKYFPQSPMARLFVSRKVIGNIGAERPELLHCIGTALTALRPSGTAVIHGMRVDVVTEGDLIEKGTPVKVVAIEGMRVVVREAPPGASGGPDPGAAREPAVGQDKGHEGQTTNQV